MKYKLLLITSGVHHTTDGFEECVDLTVSLSSILFWCSFNIEFFREILQKDALCDGFEAAVSKVWAHRALLVTASESFRGIFSNVYTSQALMTKMRKPHCFT